MSSQADKFPGAAQLAAWRERLADGQKFVYVIAGDEAPPIKVGVAKDPLSRLRGLQQGNWQTLRLLYVLPGGYELEADFHRRLAEFGLVGEWFGGEGAQAFLDWIDGASAVAFEAFDRSGTLPSALPPPKRIVRVGLQRSSGWKRGGLVSRWRTIDKPEQNPVTVRFVDPQTLVPDLQRRAERQRSERNAAVLRTARNAADSPFNPEADAA